MSPDLIFYENRIKTFHSWPTQIKPGKVHLASLGFYYTGNNDTVECFSCGLRLNQWQRDDDPMAEHKIRASHCLFLKMIGQLKYAGYSSDFFWNPWSSHDLDLRFDTLPCRGDRSNGSGTTH